MTPLTPLGLLLGLWASPALAADDALVRATRLPVVANDLRGAGVPEADVAAAIRTTQEHGLSAGEAEEVLEEGGRAAREHGPIDNFGAFVQDRLAEGLRGRDLAQAIREEHARSGKGKGHDKSKGKGGGPPDGKGGGPPDGKGGGPPDDKGGGPPDGKGGGAPDAKGKGNSQGNSNPSSGQGRGKGKNR
jgi:hypothetical protein